jgi:integrase
MLVKRGKGGLLFPTKNGQPNFDFLDMAKAVAKRAGIEESEVWLHKFRLWMGHTDLASTLRYLKPNRSVVEKVEAIWK